MRGIDPLMGLALDDFFASRCTIQSRTDARDAAGQSAPAWADLAGHLAIHCQLYSKPAGYESRQPAQTITVQQWTCALREAYPTVTTLHRCVVDGTAYDIVGVSTDSAGHATYLTLELVS
jgi:head-tail adaptor